MGSCEHGARPLNPNIVTATGLLNLHLKSRAATGAVDGVLALDARQSEGAFAVRATVINVGLAVTPFVPLQREKVADAARSG